MNQVAARRVARLFAAVAIASAGAAAARAEDRYAIKLTRPVKVGQQFTVTCKADVHDTAKVNGNGQAKNTDEKFAVDMAGTLKVVAVNAKTGLPTKVTVTLDKLTKGDDAVFEAGTVITADHLNERPRYQVGGGEVSPAQAAVLETVIDLESADRTATEDQLSGTPDRQAVGAKWDGDAAKIASQMADERLPVSAEHVKESSRLVDVKAVDGVSSQIIESTLTVDALDKGKDFHGLTVGEGSIEGTVTETLPDDGQTPATATDEHLVLEVKGTGGNGAVTADITSDRTIHRTMTQIK